MNKHSLLCRFLVGSEELPQKTDSVAAGEQTTAPPFSTTHDDRLTVRSASLPRYLESTPFLAAILRRCAYVSRTLKATPKHRTCVHADGCGYYTLRVSVDMEYFLDFSFRSVSTFGDFTDGSKCQGRDLNSDRGIFNVMGVRWTFRIALLPWKWEDRFNVMDVWLIFRNAVLP